ncbi:hypothetical protein JQ615_23550 [Bradyrhizobium jicamae]|uniref:HTH cro/C1-type domain-containing protein n=1 Tax=Bradyrhizobium jicamae TaxID=280332 RepID=A0ABS5FNI0_9BRAD|nr:hypothetical protein [Bradyrhizobium jicamae]MBR0798366.1 hypothetical protein [Bradyrhizobium jicamae]MBR0936282.1 hypothetical protein [Bradyrhizobium jicamae]
MSTSQDEHIEQQVQARWLAIGLSQADLAAVLRTNSARTVDGASESAKIDGGRLATLAEVLGIAADVANPQAAPAARARARIQASQSLQSLLELRMMRVFREVQNPDARRVLVELAEQIVKRQAAPPEAG